MMERREDISVLSLVYWIWLNAFHNLHPEVKKQLWCGEFWFDGYYIATVSGRGDKKVIEEYINNQGRQKDVKQLRLFEL